MSVVMAHRLSKEIQTAQSTGSQYCDSTLNAHVGLPTVPNEHEKQLIVDRFAFFACRVFATNNQTLKTIARKIAKDGREGYPNKYQSNDWVTRFEQYTAT